MRAKLAWALFLLIALGNPIYAQSPCLECLKATQDELKKCLSNAVSHEDKRSCEDKHKEGAEVCPNGKCKMERERKDSNREVLTEKR